MRDACAAAVDAALGAGASYADARAAVRRSQSVRTKNGRVETLTDGESEGIGVRVLVGGAWGFASDRRLSPEGARDAALRACGFAAAAGRTQPRALAPVDARSGSYRTPVERDPFAVPLDEKVALCLRIEESLRHARRQGRRGVAARPGRAKALPLLRRDRGRPGARRVRRRHAGGGDPTTESCSSAPIRASTSARARRPGGSTSRASLSNRRGRGSRRRQPRCSGRTSAPQG